MSPFVGEIFLHHRTGKLYRILHDFVTPVDLMENEHPNDRSIIIYQRLKDKRIFARPRFKFFGVGQQGVQTVHRFRKLEGKELEQELKRQRLKL